MEEDRESSEEEIGPLPAPKKPRVKVSFNDSKYLSHLPSASFYEKSFMHASTVKHVASSVATRYLASASDDGCIKFWFYDREGISFAKHVTAHKSAITGMRSSADGLWLGTISLDRTYKHFDFATFDLVNIVKLDYTPQALEFVTPRGEPAPVVAIAGPLCITLYKPTLHSRPVKKFETSLSPHLLRFNRVYQVLLAGNKEGDVDVLDVATFKFPLNHPQLRFGMKSETSLYEVRKARTWVVSMEVSPNGEWVAMYCHDSMIRVFKFATLKLFRVYDESVELAD